MPKGREKARRRMPPSAYVTMPHYFPTEQVDIVKKIMRKGRRKKK